MTDSTTARSFPSPDVLTDLRARFPETPFLALGQTVWWDEPIKAVLRLMLDKCNLGGKMVMGVHDTDYFAKARVRQAGQSRFDLVAHNDGSTKDLWSAAGEISRLFGSETYPTRHELLNCGVPVEKLARTHGEKLEFLNSITEAWGWRGLVYTGSRDLIVNNLPLRDMGDTVEEMLRWGFHGTEENIVETCCQKEARAIGHRLLAMVTAYRAANPDRTLSDLYQHVLPRIFELLLGQPPKNVEVTSTSDLLRLSPETASLPRFQFVDLFLNENTRAVARETYNQAVAGSEIYTLDRFGLGAIPFDLVLPQHGRGTLRVTLRAIHVETRKPIRIPLKTPITGIYDLAQVLKAEFGDRVTIVGKAVALISMLAREFIFVFNEEGSLYVRRTRMMNDMLKAKGIGMEVHPILRLRYSTWDAMEVGHTTLRLPGHLAATFGQKEMPAAEFSAKWHTVIEEQTRLLEDISRIRKPRELLTFLESAQPNGWRELLAAYDAAKRKLCVVREAARMLQRSVDELYDRLSSVKAGIRATERQKGDHFRSTQVWSPEATEARAKFDQLLSELLAARKEILAAIARMKEERLALERGQDAESERARVVEIETRAESARLELVRNALLTSKGLPHTNHRPTAWWLPMLDPYGNWFNRIADTTEFYTEEL